MVVMDTRMLKRNMYNFIHDPEAANPWESRELPDTEDIDVPDRRQTAKSSSIPRQIWVLKYRHGITDTGKFMNICPLMPLLSTNYQSHLNNSNKRIRNGKETKVKISIKRCTAST
jgi:hypothetical protein